MGTLHFLCFVIEVGQQRISARGFQSFFKLQSWKDLWEPSELGRLFSLGLSQYGPNAVEGIVEPTFKSTRDCLLWFFGFFWEHIIGFMSSIAFNPGIILTQNLIISFAVLRYLMGEKRSTSKDLSQGFQSRIEVG